MRMMLKVAPQGVIGNRAVLDGTLSRVLNNFIEKFKPEASYFCAEQGERMAYLVFDLKDLSQIPAIAEPMFNELGAKIDCIPVMNGDDLQRGLASLMKR